MVYWFHRWLPWFTVVLAFSHSVSSDHRNETSIGAPAANTAFKLQPTTFSFTNASSNSSVDASNPVHNAGVNKSANNKFNGEHNSVSESDSIRDISLHGISKESAIIIAKSSFPERDKESRFLMQQENTQKSILVTTLPPQQAVTTPVIINTTDRPASVTPSATPTVTISVTSTPTSTTTTTQEYTSTSASTSGVTEMRAPTVVKSTATVPITTITSAAIDLVLQNTNTKSTALPTVVVDAVHPKATILPTIVAFDVNTTSTRRIPPMQRRPKNVSASAVSKSDQITAVLATTSVSPPFSPTNAVDDVNLTSELIESIDTLLPFHRHPEFEYAKVTWGWAWEFHVYATGVLFAFIAAINFVCCLRLYCFQKLPGRGYFVALNIVLLTLGLTRTSSFFEDAYNLSGALPTSLAFFIFDIGFACLTSAFAILFLALLQSTKVVVLGGLQRPPALASVIMFHCCVTVMADVLAGEIGTRLKFLIVCVHAFSVSWLFCLTVTYFWAFRLLYVAALRKQGEIIRFTFTKLHIEGAPLPPRIPNPSLALAVRVVLVAATLGFFLCFVQLLGILGVYKVCGIYFPLPWGWWAYQTVNRCLEFLVALALTYVATQPLHHNDLLATQESCCSLGSVLSCCTCMTSSLSTDDIYPTYCASNAAVARTNFTFERWESANAATASNDGVPGSSAVSAVHGLGFKFAQGRPEINTVSTMSSAPAGCTHSSSSLATKSEFRSLGSRRQFTRATLATLSDFHNAHNRPAPMLLNDNGFIRFRENGDMEQTVITDDGLYFRQKEGFVAASKGADGMVKHTGNCTPILQGVLKDYHTYRVSGGSIDTDVSSPDHMSTGNTRHACLHRHGSACSSESAATSFDVHFYLNPPTMTKTQELCRRRSANSTPCKEVGVQSDRPVGMRPAAPPNLNLPSSPAMQAPNNGQQSQDITPDSAIFLEMPTTDGEYNQEGGILIRNFPGSTEEQDLTFSQSLNDLHCNTSNSSNGVTPRHRHRSRSLLARLKGSSFSLTSHHGYEPLESRVQSQSTLGRKSRMWRTSSEDPLRSQHPNHPNYKDFKQWEMRTVFRGSGASSRVSRDHQRDSFYNSDVSMTTGSREMVMYVDTEVQTEPMEFTPAPPVQTPIAAAPTPQQESVV